MRRRTASLLGCLLLLTAGCGGESEPEAGDPTPAPETSEAPPSTEPSPTETTTSSQPPAEKGTSIVVGDSDYGDMLFDDTGQAIYLFDVETSAEPRCYDECAEAWPPVLTEGDPVAGDGVDQSLLGTTEREDGGLQVTYNDHPLYFYAHEGKDEVLCHDVFLNGGNWYVVQPGGDAAPPG